MSPRTDDDRNTLRDYLRVLRRRRGIIIGTTIAVTVIALLFALTEGAKYQAASDVLLGRQNLANQLNGVNDPNTSLDFDRIAQTQADLAASPEVAARTLKAAGITDRTPRELLAQTDISVKPNADLLEFRVTDAKKATAVRLANVYAAQFVIYRRGLDTAALERARVEVQGRLTALANAGRSGSKLYADLASKEQQLRTLEALQGSNATLVRRADEAFQVQPRPVRNVVLGLLVGLVLGLALAFIREALDTRVRNDEELSEILGIPLLARLPAPTREQSERNQLVMLDEPHSLSAEAFRLLRTNLEFSNLEHQAKVIMVTSAVEAEGKSTTLANLAVAFARAGKRVALVDLDLRRPKVSVFFDLDRSPGVTDAAIGTVTLDDALRTIMIPAAGSNADEQADLRVLTSGPMPPDPGEFVGGRLLAPILDTLREEMDVVLVDAPPILTVGDALTLSARVDAMFLVARMKVIRRPMMNELARLLGTARCPCIGFVVAGAEQGAGYGYGYGYSYGPTPPTAVAGTATEGS